MNSIEFTQYLKSLNACEEAKLWASNKSWREVYNTCHRGDWLLWLYRRSKGYDFQYLTLVKGLCANTVRHLMKDEQSVKAVDVAIAFGKGEISKEQLQMALVKIAENLSSYFPTMAEVLIWYLSAAAYAAAAEGGPTAKKENQQKTADIVREILPFEIWQF